MLPGCPPEGSSSSGYVGEGGLGGTSPELSRGMGGKRDRGAARKGVPGGDYSC